MATFLEFTEQAEQEVKENYNNKDRKQVIVRIESIIADLNGVGLSGKVFENYTADELSIMGGVLSTLRASLIDYKVEAFRQTIVTEQFVKARTAGVRSAVKTALSQDSIAKKEKAPTADDVSAEVDRQLVKTNLIHKFNQVEYEKIQSYWYSIPDILYRIEQRINVIQGDRSTSKFMKDSSETEIPDIGVQSVDYSQTKLD